MGEFLEVDCSYGEGGGQLVRSALFLSTFLKVPVRLYNVRVKRERKGLGHQHLNVVKFLKRFAKAKVKGDELGSTELLYEPRSLRGGKYEVSFDTAGSASLFFQAVLPLLPFAPGGVEVKVVGGTDVPKSPTVDWLRFVFLPHLLPLARTLKLEVLKRGFYPEGGGVVVVRAEGFFEEEPSPEERKAFLRERLSLKKEEGGRAIRSHVFSVAHEELRERKVAERQARSALEVLKEAGLPEPQTYRQYAQARSLGSSTTVWVEDERGNLLGADALGKKGKPSEKVGREAAEKLLEDLREGATVDRHLADHLVPLLGLAGGAIRVPAFTSHLDSNLWLTELFLGKVFEKEGKLLRA